MRELYTRFGDKIYFATIDELLNRNRKAVSSIIASAIPEKPVYFEDWIDDDGQGAGPWKIACTMSKDNDKLSFDFTGTDPQSPSSINFFLSINMCARHCSFPFQLLALTSLGSSCSLASTSSLCSKFLNLSFLYLPPLPNLAQ